MAHFGSGAVAVVGHGLDDDCHTTRRVSLVAQLGHVVGFVRAGTASDCAVDDVARHVGRQRLIHSQAQAWIIRRHTAAVLGRHGQFADQLGEDLAPLGVLALFAVLDIGPFGMTSHNSLHSSTESEIR